MDTLLPRYRQSVQWVVATLAGRGVEVSPKQVRRYTALLPYRVGRVKGRHAQKGQTERQYTERDALGILTILLLKRIGYSDEDVRAFFKAPDKRTLETRVASANRIVRYAQQLVSAGNHTNGKRQGK